MNDLNLLNNNFKRAIVPLLIELKNKGIDFQVTSTKRSRIEQDQLTKDGYPTATDSNHFEGMAVDLWIPDSGQRNSAILLARAKGFRVVTYGFFKDKDLRPLLHVDFGKKKVVSVLKSALFMPAVILIGVVLYGFFQTYEKPSFE